MAKKYKKIIAIITHKANADKVAAIQKTWLSKPLPLDYLVMFVHGNDGGFVPRLEGNRLYLPAKESWENLPNKMYDLYQYCDKNFEFDYLFKIDDDVYFRPKWLTAYPWQIVDYAGIMGRSLVHEQSGSEDGNIHKHGLQNRYSGKYPACFAMGSFYVLSHKVVRAIASKRREELEDCQMSMGYEDFMVSKIVAEEIGKDCVRDDWNVRGMKKYFFRPYYFRELSADQILHEHQFFYFLTMKKIISNCVYRLRKIIIV